jgi:hypothetical protein
MKAERRSQLTTVITVERWVASEKTSSLFS